MGDLVLCRLFGLIARLVGVCEVGVRLDVGAAQLIGHRAKIALCESGDLDDAGDCLEESDACERRDGYRFMGGRCIHAFIVTSENLGSSDRGNSVVFTDEPFPRHDPSP